MTRFVLRNGEVIRSSRSASELDVYCYGKETGEQTCLLLSEQAEAKFLMQCGDDLNLHFNV